jgi:hypothetical protein
VNDPQLHYAICHLFDGDPSNDLVVDRTVINNFTFDGATKDPCNEQSATR